MVFFIYIILSNILTNITPVNPTHNLYGSSGEFTSIPRVEENTPEWVKAMIWPKMKGWSKRAGRKMASNIQSFTPSKEEDSGNLFFKICGIQRKIRSKAVPRNNPPHPHAGVN